MRVGLAAIALVVLSACGDSPPEEPSTISPLLSADPDRLWILARASPVGDGRTCKELYLSPEDPRYQGRRQACDFWTRDYADYLRVNGFPFIEHLHLQDPVYWRWYLDKRKAISDCKAALGNLPIGLRDADQRKEHQRQRSACDPYDNAVNNQGLLPNELGIHN